VRLSREFSGFIVIIAIIVIVIIVIIVLLLLLLVFCVERIPAPFIIIKCCVALQYVGPLIDDAL
jgi:hypothetical protein